jgi:hypothetical protein
MYVAEVKNANDAGDRNRLDKESSHEQRRTSKPASRTDDASASRLLQGISLGIIEITSTNDEPCVKYFKTNEQS